jgi:hypothetical protein
MSCQNSWLRVILRATLYGIESREHDEERMAEASTASSEAVLEIPKHLGLRQRKIYIQNLNCSYPWCSAAPFQTRDLLESHVASHFDWKPGEKLKKHTNTGMEDKLFKARIDRFISEPETPPCFLGGEIGRARVKRKLEEIQALLYWD